MNARFESPTEADFGLAPERIIELSPTEMYGIPLKEQARIQLTGASKRFEQLADNIPMLGRLAQEQGITKISSLEDLGPLLVPHSALKSYPMSYLEKSQFDRLTAWLNGFTTHDISALNTKNCDSIDDWLDVLDQNTEVRVLHSTGTGGKLSFLPRGTAEMKIMVTAWRQMFDLFRDEPPRMGAAVEEVPTIFVQYRKGAMAQHRLLDYLQEYMYNGDASKIVTTNPSRFSADAASIGGRLRVAQAKGELGKLQISPKLMARRDAFLKGQERSATYMDDFFNEVNTRFRGKPVSIMAHIPMLFNVATEGLKRGLENVFAKDTFILAAGGMGGVPPPPPLPPTLDPFFGGAPLSDRYGITEVIICSRARPLCPYHLTPLGNPF